MYKKLFKRILDLLIALMVLIILSPIYIFLTILLYFANDGKAFFTQERVGKNDKIFKLLKFKSMNDKTDSDGILLPDVKRLTSMGIFIRKTSLDELPQIFNVIKGDMSIIGPRPLLPQYLPYYSTYHSRRHEVKPGVTGLAQTQGRNNLKFSERFNLDVKYVDNVCFSGDVKILIQTIVNLFVRTSDVKIGRPLSELDDVGVSKGLSKNMLNIKEESEDDKK